MLSPTDGFSNFELLAFLLADPPGAVPRIPGSFARQGLKDGIAMQDAKSFNPYKFAFLGGSDAHNSAVPYRQDNFFGGHAALEATLRSLLRRPLREPSASSCGQQLACVY